MIPTAQLHRLMALTLPLAFGFAIPVSASAQVSVQQAEPQKTFTLPQVLEVVGRAIEQPAPADLSPAERRNYAAQTEWLETVQARLQETGKRLGILESRDAASREARARRRAGRGEIEKEIDKLKQMLEREGRKLNTTSNVSKARHDVAMKAIQNMRA